MCVGVCLSLIHTGRLGTSNDVISELLRAPFQNTRAVLEAMASNPTVFLLMLSGQIESGDVSEIVITFSSLTLSMYS